MLRQRIADTVRAATERSVPSAWGAAEMWSLNCKRRLRMRPSPPTAATMRARRMMDAMACTELPATAMGPPHSVSGKREEEGLLMRRRMSCGQHCGRGAQCRAARQYRERRLQRKRRRGASNRRYRRISSIETVAKGHHKCADQSRTEHRMLSRISL